MAVLTKSGRTAIAASIASRRISLAWGTGDPAWDEAFEPEPADAEALVNEVGRRTLHEVSFCAADEQAEIPIPTARLRKTDTPSNNLYLSFKYDFEDGMEHQIREVGIFIDTVVDENLPQGQRYFLPQDITDPGILFQLERLSTESNGQRISAPINRTPATRETFEFVVTF